MKKNVPVLFIAAALLAVAMYQVLDTKQSQSADETKPSLGLMNNQTSGNPSLTEDIKQLRNYLQTHPDDADHWIQLGNLLFDDGNFSEAINPYAEALRLKPENPDVRTDRGVCLFNTGQDEAAIAEFEKALQYNPNHVTATFNLGIVHARMGHTQLAAQFWKKTITLSPDSEMGKKAARALADAGNSK